AGDLVGGGRERAHRLLVHRAHRFLVHAEFAHDRFRRGWRRPRLAGGFAGDLLALDVAPARTLAGRLRRTPRGLAHGRIAPGRVPPDMIVPRLGLHRIIPGALV